MYPRELLDYVQQLNEKYNKWENTSKRRSLRELRKDTIEWLEEARKMDDTARIMVDEGHDFTKVIFQFSRMALAAKYACNIELIYLSRLEKELEKYKSKVKKTMTKSKKNKKKTVLKKKDPVKRVKISKTTAKKK